MNEHKPVRVWTCTNCSDVTVLLPNGNSTRCEADMAQHLATHARDDDGGARFVEWHPEWPATEPPPVVPEEIVTLLAEHVAGKLEQLLGVLGVQAPQEPVMACRDCQRIVDIEKRYVLLHSTRTSGAITEAEHYAYTQLRFHAGHARTQEAGQ